MKRREFITLLGGATATWPLAARAQRPARRIGVIMGTAESGQEAQARIGAFRQGLQRLGWTEGRNVHIDYRYTLGEADRIRMLANEIVALQPDVILFSTGGVTATLQRETETIPIVFVVVPDPVGSGLVESLTRPGGNITGFINNEPSIAGKWVKLLKEIAPHVRRMSLIYNPLASFGNTSPYIDYFEAAARVLGVEPIATPVRNTAEIESTITALGRDSGVGLIVSSDSFLFIHRGLAISVAARHNVPTIYFARLMVSEGGLISYGIDAVDLYRRAAPYVDRILKGEKPADLPVQAPVKFELVVNLKTAKALGLNVPATLLALADEVIE